MSLNGLVSRGSDEWQTPPALFDPLNAIFHFDLDAAATAENTKCKRYLTDALKQSWCGQRIWLNPPYSKVSAFMHMARINTGFGHQVILCLVPARTDTSWFWSAQWAASGIVFLTPRVSFIRPGETKPTPGTPFPSALIKFGGAKIGVRWWRWRDVLPTGIFGV